MGGSGGACPPRNLRYPCLAPRGGLGGFAPQESPLITRALPPQRPCLALGGAKPPHTCALPPGGGSGGLRPLRNLRYPCLAPAATMPCPRFFSEFFRPNFFGIFSSEFFSYVRPSVQKARDKKRRPRIKKPRIIDRPLQAIYWMPPLTTCTRFCKKTR